MPDFIEFTFLLPFGDLVFENWSAAEEVLDGREITEIARFLDIEITPKKLLDDYSERQFRSGDAFFFFSPTRRGSFLCLDFFDDPTDQCGMVSLGIRCPMADEIEVLALLQKLHRKGAPRSALAIDWSNTQLLSKVRNPEFYLKNRRVHFLPEALRAGFLD